MNKDTTIESLRCHYHTLCIILDQVDNVINEENKVLKRLNVERKTEIAQQKLQLSSLKSMLTKCTHELEETEMENEILHHENSFLSQKVEDLQNENSALQAEIHMLTEESDVLECLYDSEVADSKQLNRFCIELFKILLDTSDDLSASREFYSLFASFQAYNKIDINNLLFLLLKNELH